MDAGLATTVAAQLRNLGLALPSARAQAAILLRTCARATIRARATARARTAARPCPARLLPRRRPGSLLRALRIAARGAPGRRRGAASKANALSPLVAVVNTVCHSNRLASCITCLSYKKRCATNDRMRKKLGKRHERGKLGAIKRNPSLTGGPRHQNGCSQRAASLAVRPKNGAARFSVLPSVELQAELLRQGRILKPRNKRARQNRLRKG